MLKVVVASMKGGAGKSTIALNLAAEAARRGMRTLFVDADPQASASLFAAARPADRPPFRTVRMGETLHRDLPDLAASFALVIVDTPGVDAQVLRGALASADVVLSPVRPAAADLWRAEDFLALVARLGAKAPPVAMVLSQVPPRTRLAAEAAEHLASIADRDGVRLLPSRIGSRAAWAESGGAGLAVTELEPHGAAAQELLALWTALDLPRGDK